MTPPNEPLTYHLKPKEIMDRQHEDIIELRTILRMFLDDIKGDPRAHQFFDPRLVARAKAAAESNTDWRNLK